MALLRQKTSDTSTLTDYASDLPPGKYPALCVDIDEQHNVERPKYKSADIETVDLITFHFEITGKSGTARRIRTKEMRISLFEKSALYGFLTAWCGEPPADAFDTDTLMGCKAELTLEHAPSKTDPQKKYVRIMAIAPGTPAKTGGNR